MNKKGLLLVCILALSSFLTLFSQEKFSVMVYTSPDYWHNPVIPTAITEFKKLAEKHFFDMEWTQQPSVFNQENLEKFAVVVFLQSNGASLDEGQMASLKKFIQQGGGFVGIHAASVTRDQGAWFQKLIGRSFTGHPEKQTAVLQVADKGFPACMHLTDQFLWTDEWYEFGDALTDNMKVVMTVDETTYIAKRMDNGTEINGMGSFHPIAWYQEYDGGRSFYTALGHMGIHYTDARFLEHIYGGIYWAATGKGITDTSSDHE